MVHNYIFAPVNTNMAKHHFSSLGEIIAHCTTQKLPFALYSLPDEKQIHCITQDSGITALDENSSFPSAEGFILYPFQYSKAVPAYFIRAEHKFSFLDNDITKEDTAGNYIFDTPTANNAETTKPAYCQKITQAVNTINKGDIQKVILSRVQNTGTDVAPIAAYIELFQIYPSAFVSLVYIPGKVLWITASPELLISSSEDELKTVALAGTKKLGKADWTDKEREEQQMVTEYIHSVLDKNCVNIKMDGPHETIAGNVVHLKTSFTAKLDAGLWDLVMELHPTPAVCGIPKKQAMEFIAGTESHQRKYYAGFLGPCNVNGETNLFVNLRCAELSNNRADLFIGGGITSGSVLESEWEETVLKANTLLSVLKPVTEKTT